MTISLGSGSGVTGLELGPLVPRISILWGHVKNEICSTPVTNVDELGERIAATFDAIRNRAGQLERVRESMMRRLNGCVAANGQHFEHLM
jgi:hypothetical protein